MLFHRLFPAAVFSLALALTGCGGMDDTLSPHIKPDGGSNPNGSSKPNPEEPKTEKPAPSYPDLGDGVGGDDGTQVEGGDNGSIGGVIPGDNNKPPQANFCPIPSDSGNTGLLLGNTGDKGLYDIGLYDEVISNDLTGTWIVTLNDNTKSSDLSSLNMQRYAFVIKKDSTDNNKYQAANCSGLAVKEFESEEVCTLFDGTSKVVPCDTPGAQRKPDIVHKEIYLPWADYIAVNLNDNKISLPLYLPSLFQPEEGIGFTLVNGSYSRMASESGAYQAVKISSSTNPLGKSSLSITNEGNIKKETSDAAVSCIVHTKVVLNNCETETPTINTVAAILAVTEKDLHQIATADATEAENEYLLLMNYIKEGDKLGLRDKEGNKVVNPDIGRFVHHSTDKVNGNDTAEVDFKKTNLDISTQSGFIKLQSDLP